MKHPSPRRKAITLVELLLVLTLISIASASLTIGAYRTYRQEIFHRSAASLVERFRAAQTLLCVAQVETHFRFFLGKKGEIYCRAEIYGTEAPNPYELFIEDEGNSEEEIELSTSLISSSIPSAVRQEEQVLRGVQGLWWREEGGTIVRLEEIGIGFFSPGGRMSKGVLGLVQEGRLHPEIWIQLKGYPSPIFAAPLPLGDFENGPLAPAYPQDLADL